LCDKEVGLLNADRIEFLEPEEGESDVATKGIAGSRIRYNVLSLITNNGNQVFNWASEKVLNLKRFADAARSPFALFPLATSRQNRAEDRVVSEVENHADLLVPPEDVIMAKRYRIIHS